MINTAMNAQMRTEFDAFLMTRKMNFEALARGHYQFADGSTMQVDDVMVYLISQRPSLFATAFLQEPDTGEPYQFWDYQIPSVNHLSTGVIHEDGAEVGKTREIITLLLWSAFTRHGGQLKRAHSLVSAPLQGHLNEIIDGIVEQMEGSADLKAITKAGWHRKAPYHRMAFTTGAVIDFRPAGNDGNAFRGVHANAFCIFDEATKIKNKVIWTEFWRAMKPAATSRVYSVPDGDRSCGFFHQCQVAVPYAEFTQQFPHGWNGADDRPVVRFNWAKIMMPAPFWSVGRRREFIRLYGGEDSPGYVRNVKGQWGDPESSAFPWATFGPCVMDIPEYRRLKVLVDASEGIASVELMRFDTMRDGIKTIGRDVLLMDEQIALDDWATEAGCRQSVESLIFRALPDLPAGIYSMGCDLGQTRDPTEMMVFRQIGEYKRLTARIQLRGIEYRHQCEFIRAIDWRIDPDMCGGGIGCDPGNAGTAVMGMLKSSRYLDRSLDDRVSGYGFGNGYDAVDLDGHTIYDQKTDKPLRQNGKELSTDLLVMAMQQRKRQYPLDPELSLYYPSHTYSIGPRWRKFATKDDHAIDADRQEMMNALLASGGGWDGFACGVSYR